jgi:hypothetical protein
VDADYLALHTEAGAQPVLVNRTAIALIQAQT